MPGRRWIAGSLIVVSINALVASFGFVSDPDGSSIGIPQEWLEDSPFDDYLIPGLILGVMGVLALVAAVMQLRRHGLAWFAAGFVGVGFVVWIIVQSAMMGSFRHPMQTILQAVILAVGLVVSFLALGQLRALRRHRRREER